MLGEGKPVVLVVDDEPAIRLLCKVNLELAGYEVREAGSIGAARAQLGEQLPDAVLLDVHVGTERSDGLLAELRERGIPVAIVTGSADASALRASADAVLAKPFAMTELEEVVAGLTGRGR